MQTGERETGRKTRFRKRHANRSKKKRNSLDSLGWRNHRQQQRDARIQEQDDQSCGISFGLNVDLIFVVPLL